MFTNKLQTQHPPHLICTWNCMAQASHCKQMLLGWLTGYSSHSELQLQNTALSFKACTDRSSKISSAAVKMIRVWHHTFCNLKLLKLWHSKDYFNKNTWAKSGVAQGLIHAQGKKCRASTESCGLWISTLKPLWDIYHFLRVIKLRPQNLDSSTFSHLPHWHQGCFDQTSETQAISLSASWFDKSLSAFCHKSTRQAQASLLTACLQLAKSLKINVS